MTDPPALIPLTYRLTSQLRDTGTGSLTFAEGWEKHFPNQGQGLVCQGKRNQSTARGLGFSPTRELLAKQQLFAILATLLEHVINSLGQFVRNDVVDHHLPRSAPVPLQLPLIVASHPRIATHCMHGRLR